MFLFSPPFIYKAGCFSQKFYEALEEKIPDPIAPIWERCHAFGREPMSKDIHYLDPKEAFFNFHAEACLSVLSKFSLNMCFLVFREVMLAL